MPCRAWAGSGLGRPCLLFPGLLLLGALPHLRAPALPLALFPMPLPSLFCLAHTTLLPLLGAGLLHLAASSPSCPLPFLGRKEGRHCLFSVPAWHASSLPLFLALCPSSPCFTTLTSFPPGRRGPRKETWKTDTRAAWRAGVYLFCISAFYLFIFLSSLRRARARITSFFAFCAPRTRTRAWADARSARCWRRGICMRLAARISFFSSSLLAPHMLYHHMARHTSLCRAYLRMSYLFITSRLFRAAHSCARLLLFHMSFSRRTASHIFSLFLPLALCSGKRLFLLRSLSRILSFSLFLQWTDELNTEGGSFSFALFFAALSSSSSFLFSNFSAAASRIFRAHGRLCSPLYLFLCLFLRLIIYNI